MKKNYTLHYDPIRIEKNSEDIQKYEFNNHYQMIDFIDEKTYMRRNQCVWVLSKDDLEDVFVSKNALSIQDFLEKKKCWRTKGVFHLFECQDFNEAYDLAKNIHDYPEMLELWKYKRTMNKVYEFWYNECIYESAAQCMSLHKTREGAEKAMERHKKQIADKWGQVGVENFVDMAWGIEERIIEE